VYSIDGLRLDEGASPCDTKHSRWRRHHTASESTTGGTSCGVGEAMNDSIAQGTLETLTSLLRDGSANDPNPLLLDIYVPTDAECDPSTSVHARLEVPDVTDEGTVTCWEFVHPNLHNVYDFSEWSDSDQHPGNDIVEPNPIKAPAFQGVTVLNFPISHPMSRWNGGDFPYVGRLGDVVEFKELPWDVKSKALASELGTLYDDSLANQTSENHHQVCGSPGEASNQPSLGSRFSFETDGWDFIRKRTDESFDDDNTAKSIWIMVSLFSKDQLRQRIAFALSGILVVGKQNKKTHESRMAFHDIFVRHAFGNYRDVLKEVTYSALMGEYLTYKGSGSYAYSGRFPDENYARELMQLFTIGLVQLDKDGIVTTDKASGEPVATYDNDDISEFRPL